MNRHKHIWFYFVFSLCCFTALFSGCGDREAKINECEELSREMNGMVRELNRLMATMSYDRLDDIKRRTDEISKEVDSIGQKMGDLDCKTVLKEKRERKLKEAKEKEKEKAAALTSKEPTLSLNDLPGVPKFSSTSNEAILLRYKHKNGQKVGFDVAVDMTMEINDQKIPMIMKMNGEYEVESVDQNGDTKALLKIGHMTMKSSSPVGSIEFDSDKNTSTSNPMIDMLSNMVNVGIMVKISAVGKILDIDKNPFYKVVDVAANAALKQQMDQIIDQMTKGAFIQLSVDPVIAGDVYDAGKTVTSNQGIETTIHAKYKLISVDADKKQALLSPIGKFDIKSSDRSIDLKLNQGDMVGWILFDLVKGNIVKSYGESILNITLSKGDQSMTMKTTTVMHYHTTFF